MKKSLQLIGVLFTMFCCIEIVHAAPSQSFYTSANSIEAGGKVTATLQLKNVAAWNIKITSNGSTSGCDASFADATSNGGNTTKNLSVTCKSTGVGQISFRVSGDATSADGSSVSVSGVKVVTVTTPRAKDSNNYLKSLNVSGYELSTPFQKDTLEYSVDVPSTVNKVVIEASADSGYASVRGTGEVEVEEGANTFDVVVTSETGTERTYKLTINVKDENPINVSLGELELTIVKNIKNITKPDLYELTSIKIGDVEVPAFVSDITGFTLVAVKDKDGKVFFAIYDQENNRYTLYNEQKSASMVLYIMDPEEDLNGYIKSSITINGKDYVCFKVKDESHFAIVYAMNVETGKKHFYVYYGEDNTFQEYDVEMIQFLQAEQEKYRQVILGGAVLCGVLFLGCILGILRKPNKKLLKKLAMYEAKIKSSSKTSEVETLDNNEVDVKEEIIEKKKKRVKKDNNAKKKATKKVETSKENGIVEKKIDDIPDEVKVEDALSKMNDAEEIILEYEKTMSLSKDELKKAKEIQNKKKTIDDDAEEMYDMFAEDKKSKRKKK